MSRNRYYMEEVRELIDTKAEMKVLIDQVQIMIEDLEELNDKVNAMMDWVNVNSILISDQEAMNGRRSQSVLDTNGLVNSTTKFAGIIDKSGLVTHTVMMDKTALVTKAIPIISSADPILPTPLISTIPAFQQQHQPQQTTNTNQFDNRFFTDKSYTYTDNTPIPITINSLYQGLSKISPTSLFPMIDLQNFKYMNEMKQMLQIKQIRKIHKLGYIWLGNVNDDSSELDYISILPKTLSFCYENIGFNDIFHKGIFKNELYWKKLIGLVIMKKVSPYIRRLI